MANNWGLPRAENKIFDKWMDWYSEQTGAYPVDILGDQGVQILLEKGMYDFIAFVLDEFPMMSEIGFDYDVEWAWNEFINQTKIGYQLDEELADICRENCDYDIIIEEIDNDVISDCYELGQLNKWLSNYKLSKKKYEMVQELFEYGIVDIIAPGVESATFNTTDIISFYGAESKMLKKAKDLKAKGDHCYIVIAYARRYNQEIALLFNDDSISTLFKKKKK